jgi:hypothetical protein
MNRHAQTTTEYIIIMGIVVTVIFAMTPLIKRGTQGMIKTVTDQIGVQSNGDQRFDERGHLEYSYVTSRSRADKTISAVGRTTSYIYNDISISTSNQSTNLGFTPGS